MGQELAVEAEARTEGSRGSRVARKLTRGPVTIVLVIVGLLWLLPTLGLLVSSFRSAADSSESGWWTTLALPSQLTLEPYLELIDDPDIIRSLVNTALITIPSSVLVVVIASLAAYAFAWMRFRGRDGLFLLVVALLVVPSRSR